MCRCGITSRAARPFGPCPPGCHPTRSPQRLTSRASPSAGLAALALRRRPPAVRLNGSRPRGLRLRGAAPLTPPARARGRARPSAGREFPTLRGSGVPDPWQKGKPNKGEVFLRLIAKHLVRPGIQKCRVYLLVCVSPAAARARHERGYSPLKLSPKNGGVGTWHMAHNGGKLS